MTGRFIILGAGPAGLALAMKLLRKPDIGAEVVVIEQKPYVGGIAASFECQGLHFDYGSHRLHPATPPELLSDLKSLMGDDLLDRPRNGRIRLLGRFVKFPLNPFEFFLQMPLSFPVGIGRDAVSKPFRQKSKSPVSFADVLLDGLGKTICNAFYFPYARKLWGLGPEEISPVQVRRRVSAGNVSKMMRKALAALPGFKSGGTGRFFYPREGFGQICRSLAREVERLGGKILLSTKVEEIRLQNGRPAGVMVRSSGARIAGDRGQVAPGFKELIPDFVFSTIPVTDLVSCINPGPLQGVMKACRRIRYRSMVLCYLILETDRFTPYDAHYFPEADTVFSRLSEPKNYSFSVEPHGLTGLCAEIPCWFGDEFWRASGEMISSLVVRDLARAGLPLRCPVRTAFARRIRHAYPVYDLDFEARFKKIDDYVNQISCLISLGRQGLYAHDNTHHTMEMAYRASECIQRGPVWDSDRWRLYREQFGKHVVED